MGSRSRIWEEAREIRARNGVPQIVLPAASRVIIPAAKRGRPRTSPVGDRYRDWAMKTPARYPMKCRNIGCTKRLRKDQVTLVCSERCHIELLEFAKCVVDTLEGRCSPQDFPWAYTQKRMHRRKSSEHLGASR